MFEDERNLVSRILEGNRDALRQLCSDYTHLIYSVARRYRALNESDREDLVQDFFVHLIDRDFKPLRQWRGDSPLGPYLLKIARNRANDVLRERRVTVPLEGEEGEEDLLPIEAGDPTPEDFAAEKEFQAMMSGALSRIDEGQRAILQMSESGMSYAEIAHSMACSTSVVGVRLFRAKARLKHIIEKEFPALRDFLRW